MLRRLLLLAAGVSAAAWSQTLLDPRQLKTPIRTGTTLPVTCTPGSLFFKTDAPPGANLYGCGTANNWSVQGGFPSQNCWYDATAQVLQCRDAQGNVFTAVKTSTAGTTNQWVDYISPAGIPHTSQPMAGQVQNAVDQTGNYSNPAWITSLAWGKLTGVPPTFNAGQLQGRAVAGTAPGDTQYLGWNSAAGQWEPKTPAVPTVFGRSGAIAAQTGDYTFAQVSGTVNAAQLPAQAMRTDQSNTVSAGTQDFHSAAHTLPAKSGLKANLPGTCSMGEMYFATDGQAGNNLYGCTAANTWTLQSSPPYTVSVDGTTAGSSATINLITGVGLTTTVTDTGSQVNIQQGLDSAVVQTQAGEQAGATLLCASTGGSTTTYQCTMNPTLSAYTAGMVLHWKPDVSASGGATTLNIDRLGSKSLMSGDGVSSPGASDIIAGHLYDVWYDGSVFRLMGASSSSGAGGSSGSVASVFGRTGAIIPQAGDYSATQIAGLAPVAISGSYADLTNKPTIPAAQVNSDWSAATGAAQILNKPTIPGIASTNSLLKGDGAGNAAAAVAGTDYLTSSTPILAAQLPAPGTSSLGGVESKDCTGSGHVVKIGPDGTVTCAADAAPAIPSTMALLKGDGAGNAAAAVAGTDYLTSSTPILAAQLPAPGTSSLGGVQSKDCTGSGHVVKIGLTGTVTCAADTAPAIPSTTALLKGDGAGNAAAAVAGTDYPALSTSNTFSGKQVFSGGASLGTSYLSTTKTAGATGVTSNTLCKIDTTGNVLTVAAGDVGVLGVCMSTQSSGGSVEVATRGIVTCTADNTTVIGNIAVVGTVTGGRCADSGQANTPVVSSTTQIIGKILSATTAGNPVSIQLYGPGHYGTLQPVGQLPLSVRTRAIAFVFDGGDAALAANKTVYLRVPYACTIADWSIQSTTAETVTVQFLRAATGGSALPSASINTSGLSLSTGNAIYSTTLTDFTSTAIAANDWLAAKLTAITASQQVTVVLGCQQ